MEVVGCQEIDLEFEAHDLVDDNQFSAVDAEKEVGINLGIDENGHLPELKESSQSAQKQRNGRYNLRKSLAWDSAFFTSAGVLDAEELSSIITGADKSEKPSLPGIQEEITESTESLSTLESDNLTLDGCEDDLFVDIRASIQRSSKKTPNLMNSIGNKAAAEVCSKAISALKKEDIVSEDKNPKPVLKKTSSLLTGRIPKPQANQILKLASGKSIKQDSVRSQVASIGKTGETNSLLPKLPKSVSSSIPSSTATAKRESMGTARVKSEGGNSRPGTISSKGAQPSKVSVLGGSRKPLSKPAVQLKSSLLGSSSTTSSVQSVRSSSSSDSSVNTSSGIPAKPKSTLMTARRNLGKSGNNSIVPSGSITRTPSRAVSKNKLPASTLSAHLMSAKISSSVSPASSISEWSSASSSSSSSSMANQRCSNSRISLDTSSCKDGGNFHLDPRNDSAVPTAERHKNQVVMSTSIASKKSSTQTGTLQAPAKPSGLRLPSPKIGFFDGVKSPARTPNGHKQSESGFRTLFPKNGDSTIQSSNSKLKSAKVPTSRMMPSLANVKSASPEAPSPVSFEEKSHASNASSVPTDVKGSSNLPIGVKGSSTAETCQKEEKLDAENGVKQVAGAGIDAIGKNSLDDSSMYKNVDSGDIKTASDEDVLINHGHLNSSSYSEAIDKGNLGDSSLYKNAGTGEVKTISGEYVLVNQDHLKKKPDSHPIHEATEKVYDDKRGVYENVHGLTCELIVNTSECEPSFPAVSAKSAVCRAPFALKNTPDSNECISMPKELVVQVGAADKTGYVLPSSEQKENI